MKKYVYSDNTLTLFLHFRVFWLSVFDVVTMQTVLLDAY